MSNTVLDTLFEASCQCKDNICKINKKDILKIYKPDLGLKDLAIKKELFGNIVQPQLCDCVVLKNNGTLIVLEIKCGTVTNHILKEIITQVSNVYKILENEHVRVNKCMFICKKFDNAMVKKRLLKEKIKGIPLLHKIYKNSAIDI